MSACTNYIEPISNDECLSSSIKTLNNNFTALSEVVCGLFQRLEKNKQVRTFFYYGPNTNSFANNDTGSLKVATTKVDILQGKASYFGDGKSFPAGLYRMQYNTGAYTIWSDINDRWNSFGLFTLYPAAILIGEGNWFPTPEVAIDRGQNYYGAGVPYYLDFYHPGGQMYMIFNDDPYQDNRESDRGAPVFDLYSSDISINVLPEITKLQGSYASRPSDNFIQAFINNENQMNLPSISNLGDIAYVIYQKTGYYNNKATGVDPSYKFQYTETDILSYTVPSFFIWRLTYQTQEEGYVVDSDFPKFSRALTNSLGTKTPNWDQPQNWTEY
jgi:hypothetical protein